MPDIGAYEFAFNQDASKHVNAPVILVEIAFNSGTRYYSNEFVRLTNCYKGKILNFPQIRSSIGDIKRTFERSKIYFIFDDSDYEFRGLETSETVGLKNIVVTVKIAFKDDDYTTRLTIYTGTIYDWRRLNNLQYKIFVSTEGKNLENKYPDKTVTITDYADAKDIAVGQLIPIPYGKLSDLNQSGKGNFPTLYVDTVNFKYLIGLQTAAITVDRVYSDEALQATPADYSTSTQVIDGKTHTLIDFVEDQENKTVTCDITFGSRKPVEAIRHFLENFCGYSSGDFNSDSYDAARDIEDNRDYIFDGALVSQQALRSILDNWRDEFELDIFQNKNDELCFNYISSDYSADLSNYKDFLDLLEGEFESNPQATDIVNYLNYSYNYRYATRRYYKQKAYQDTDSQTKYGGTFKDSIAMRWHRDGATARDIAMRKILRFKDPVTFDARLFPLKSYSDNVADKIRVTDFQGKGSSGYSENLFQIRTLEFNLNHFINKMLIEDISDWIVVENPCILGNGSVLPLLWTGASEAQREYCYLCDVTTEQFSDNEPGKRLRD